MEYIIAIIFAFLITNINACNCENTTAVRGTGEVLNPYQMCTPSEFVQYASFFPKTSSYIVCANLDFSNTTFVPFGNLSNPFEGEFNGNNFKISNYKFDFPTSTYTEYVGLFRATAGAYIHDIYIDISMNNYNRFGVMQKLRYVGSLIGSSNGKMVNNTMKQTVIKNIYVNTNVLTPTDYYNGVFGYVNNTNIYNSVFNVTSVISYGSDAVNSIAYTIENSLFKNLYVFTKLSFVGNPRYFDDSISYCSAGFGIVSYTNITDTFHTFDVQLPKFNTKTPVNLGGFSAYLTNSFVKNVFLSGKFLVDNKSYMTQIGTDNNKSIGYISGSQFNTDLQNNVYFVNV